MTLERIAGVGRLVSVRLPGRTVPRGQRIRAASSLVDDLLSVVERHRMAGASPYREWIRWRLQRESNSDSGWVVEAVEPDSDNDLSSPG